ncbi:MAG: SDR family NAD(P)-dependent oxidoreductase [Sphingobium sp.]
MRQSFAADALEGRVAVVTGAASGIGRETALLLASIGAFVWATDRDEAGLAALAGELGPRGATARHDVASQDEWRAIVASVRAAKGRLDILVNNAGIMTNAAFLDTTLDQWRHQQAVNVESVYLGMHSALPLMCETAAAHGTSTSIVNVSSVYGIVAGASFAAYSASKGAVRALSKAVANEFVTKGVRVNSLHPGPTTTNLGKDWDLKDAAGNPITEEDAAAAWLALLPMGRPGAVEDMAAAIAWLSSDAACYVTGTELVVDGGYTMR